MIPAQIIARKRDGQELTDLEIHDFIRGYTLGDIPDYQMAAMAMAIFFQGMSMRETTTLTKSLLASGTTLRWDDGVATVDKHSTGGIGDKVSLVLAPLMACFGLHVPMLSGRGLGITGGTLDKLESVPRFRTDLSVTELQQITLQVGCVITGASDDLVPADRKLYALRDVTGTVPSRPLIVASILSKKLAEGLTSLVLDVKVGRGGFMKTAKEARQLAEDLVTVAHQLGVPTTALLTDMDQPLGRAIGNAIEVQEAIELLQGGGPPEVLELSMRLGKELLENAGMASTEKEAHRLQLAKVQDGSAYAKFEEMLIAQGGHLEDLPLAPVFELRSAMSGFVHEIDVARLANVVIELGGGRRQMGDAIDHGVGLECMVRVGDEVAKDQLLLRVYARGDYVVETLLDCFVIDPVSVAKRPLILDRVTYHDQ